MADHRTPLAPWEVADWLLASLESTRRAVATARTVDEAARLTLAVLHGAGMTARPAAVRAGVREFRRRYGE